MIIHYDYRYKALVAEYLLCMRIYTMRDVTFVNGQWFEEVQDDLCCLVIRALWIFKDSPKIEGILFEPTDKAGEFRSYGTFHTLGEDTTKTFNEECECFDARVYESGLEYCDDDKRGHNYTITII
jgi:hypothetical protein